MMSYTPVTVLCELLCTEIYSHAELCPQYVIVAIGKSVFRDTFRVKCVLLCKEDSCD